MPPRSITIPHNFNVRAHQLPFLASKKRFKICVMHRRGGKTRMALNQQISKCVLQKGVYYYIMPTITQAKRVLWDELVREHVPEQLLLKKNDSELALYYKNGSIQRFVGAEDPGQLRGSNPKDVVFDEYAEFKNSEMWTSVIQPVLRENGGTASFIFTPRGRNHAWKLLQEARENRKEWFTTVLAHTETGVFSAEEIIQAQKSMPQSIFDQEFACNFLDSSTAFFKRVEQNVYRDSPPPITSQAFQIGVDLARLADYTVLTPFDQDNFVVYPQERFNQVDWNLQKAKIEAMYYRFGLPPVCIDATGIGDPIVEDLEHRGINILPFKFTETSRKDLLNNLALLLEQDKIKIPDDPELIAELQGFQFQLNKSGKVEVRTVLAHDDRVMSLALAVWQAPDAPLARVRRQELFYTSSGRMDHEDPYKDFSPV